VKKNQKAQLILIFIGTFLIIGTYFYPYIDSYKKKETIEQPAEKKVEQTIDEEKETTFENVEYKGLYDFNKPFIVKSDTAYILDEDPDVVYMNNMHVKLYLNDSRIVTIVSDKGRYNKITYDCFFEQNVKATDIETEIFAENLDLLATKNIVEIYNQVNLINASGSLKADKIDYNFENKYFKVSMFNNKKDVKIKLTQ